MSRSFGSASFPGAMLLLAGLAVAVPGSVHAQLRSTQERAGVLRICADPDNLPASNQAGEGYENKIAELIAKEWNSKLEYAWWPVRRGFFSRALNGQYCDVALTAPSALDMAGVTKPYFRSAYVIVYRKDSGLNVTSLDDPALKKLKIGINLLNSDAENTPPAMALSRHGVVGNLIGFNTFFSKGGDRPEDIINAVAKKDVDIAIVWGPIAGYFGKRSRVPLVLHPIESDTLSGLPFAFEMSMGTRRRDTALRDSLQMLIEHKRPEILAILRDYNVPLLPLSPDSAKRVGSTSPASR